VLEIDPDRLFSQFCEALELLAEPFDVQVDWIKTRDVPTSELFLQFGDVYPIFVGRLRDHGLIDDTDIERLESVRSAIHVLEQHLRDEEDSGGDLAEISQELELVRSNARQALVGLRQQ
jgi:hypothetical protein